MFWDYSANPTLEIKTSQFRIWLPDDNKLVQGMISLCPGHNSDGRDIVNAPQWQALASDINFGLIGIFFENAIEENCDYCVAGRESGEMLLDVLDKFGKENNRIDVANSKLLMWGFSAGAQFNFNFACWCPNRVKAFIINKGCCYYKRYVPKKTLKIPAILFLGKNDNEKERIPNIQQLYEKQKARGAIWELHEEENMGHDVGASEQVTINFFKNIILK